MLHGSFRAHTNVAPNDTSHHTGLKTLALLLVLMVLPELASGGMLARRPHRALTQMPLVNTDSIHGSSDWDNRTVRAQLRTRSCTLQLDIRRADAITNRDLVCLWGLDGMNEVAPRSGVSEVMTTRVDDRGRARLRANGRGAGCGQLGDTIAYQPVMTCYLTTLGTGPGEYDWQSACADAGMLALPVSDPDIAGDLRGTCVGLPGSRILPPNVPELATSGALTLGD